MAYSFIISMSCSNSSISINFFILSLSIFILLLQYRTVPQITTASAINVVIINQPFCESVNFLNIIITLLIKDHVLFAWPKNPLCLRCLYILYIFYITFNKRKKWESGPRCPQTLVLPRFRWPGFENKSGPRAKKSGPKYFSVRTNSSMAQIKVGQTHFQISISGPKRKEDVYRDGESFSLYTL